MAFTSIQGQERAINNLKQSLKKDKLHHAYLFSGPEGVGKKKTALELIKALNCDRPGAEGGCDTCPSCSKIERQIHPDVIHVQPEGTFIRIEQIRNLSQQLGYGPALGRSRLCLLDMASDLNEPAANAFLKTLEEPPPATFFVLLVRDPGELLPTIVSRCIAIGFNPLPLALIEKKLMDEKGLPEEEARALSLVSGGSLGRAIHFIKGTFWKKQETWFSQLERLPQAGVTDLMNWAKGWLGTREEVLENMEIGQWCLRDMIWIRAGLEDKVSVQPHLKERVRDLAFSLPEHIWLKRLNLLHQAAAFHRQNVNAQLNWEVLFLKMAKQAM
ncbi:MAG: DNA polymerase III subunit delta' [Thermodesulfobacteriota bacterium]